jgi:methyl coenzyme M reductase gamma subunit
MKEMVEFLKDKVGMRSDAELLKALNAILDPKTTTGTKKSPTMISKRDSAPPKKASP